MPCNTAHSYYEQVCEAVTIPVLHDRAHARRARARREDARACSRPTARCSPASISAPLSKAAWELLRRTSAADQAAVMDVIYNGVKAGDLTHNVTAFRAACEHLLARAAPSADPRLHGAAARVRAFTISTIPTLTPRWSWRSAPSARQAARPNKCSGPRSRSAPPCRPSRLSLRCAAGRRCFFMDEKLLIADDSELNRAIL